MSDVPTLNDRDRERFASKVRRGDPDACWPWAGSHFSTGYPAFWLRGRNRGAHRVALFIATGRTPEIAMHTCDNPGCVNPGHLRAGDPAANSADMVTKRRAAAGDRHPGARLTSFDVGAIRRAHAAGVPKLELAQQYGVTRRQISNVVRRAAWQTGAAA